VQKGSVDWGTTDGSVVLQHAVPPKIPLTSSAMSSTKLLLQEHRLWLNVSALTNISEAFFRLETSHCDKSLLNESASAN
jgi:hypothetical protein